MRVRLPEPFENIPQNLPVAAGLPVQALRTKPDFAGSFVGHLDVRRVVHRGASCDVLRDGAGPESVGNFGQAWALPCREYREAIPNALGDGKRAPLPELVAFQPARDR